MSPALLDEYHAVNSKDERREVLAERKRILEMVSQKAQERTLTLQETTDLYTRFNQTYEEKFGEQTKAHDDESWALKLLEECNEESSTLETRVNGIPLAKQSENTTSAKTEKQKAVEPVLNNSISVHHDFNFDESEAISVEDKPKLREAFIYEQFRLSYETQNPHVLTKSRQSFVTVITLSIVITMTALICSALFL